MPILKSSYKPNFIFRSTHFNTIYKTLFLKQKINYNRKRLDTPDNDFIDLDFSTVNSETAVIALHGLEGSSKSKYILSATQFLNNNNIDVVAVNFRGCSGEDNLHMHSYNSGKTDDLDTIINYIIINCNYKNLILLGYSMGGNIALKYLGEVKEKTIIKGSVAISVPCDLEGSSTALGKAHNYIYINRFLRTLKQKSLLKLQKYPNIVLDKNKIIKAKNFEDFDNAVTAPIFGFKNAKDYWKQCSSKQFIQHIKKPTLLINALDDTFLSDSCHPYQEAKNNEFFNFEASKYGGHVGFNSTFNPQKNLWSEKRVLEFIQHNIL